MKDLKTRQHATQAYCEQAQQNIKNNKEPKGQKFPNGTIVRIADDLGSSMRHFTSGVIAAVAYTYSHAYGGDDIKSYCLDIPGKGQVSWYEEHQLTKVEDDEI